MRQRLAAGLERLVLERNDGHEVKIAVDTNVLVRAAVRDDIEQADAATKLMARAKMVAIAAPSLCEFVWVLRSVYRFQTSDVAKAIRTLLAAENVETNRAAIDAGLAVLDADGDFADGVIAYEGRWLGAETFVSFDKKAIEMLTVQGVSARLL
jgi:predicted nucleic-acid-binding protein